MKIVLDVADMHCDGCRRAVSNAIQSADQGAKVTVDLQARRVEAETVLSTSALIALLDDVGYEARPIPDESP